MAPITALVTDTQDAVRSAATAHQYAVWLKAELERRASKISPTFLHAEVVERMEARLALWQQQQRKVECGQWFGHIDAEADLTEIIEYVYQHNPTAAHNLWERLRDSVVHLAGHPYLFKESERMPGYREIVAHPNYLVFYRVFEDRVQIDMVARRFPLEKKQS